MQPSRKLLGEERSTVVVSVNIVLSYSRHKRVLRALLPNLRRFSSLNETLPPTRKTSHSPLKSSSSSAKSSSFVSLFPPLSFSKSSQSSTCSSFLLCAHPFLMLLLDVMMLLRFAPPPPKRIILSSKERKRRKLARSRGRGVNGGTNSHRVYSFDESRNVFEECCVMDIMDIFFPQTLTSLSLPTKDSMHTQLVLPSASPSSSLASVFKRRCLESTRRKNGSSRPCCRARRMMMMMM